MWHGKSAPDAPLSRISFFHMKDAPPKKNVSVEYSKSPVRPRRSQVLPIPLPWLWHAAGFRWPLSCLTRCISHPTTWQSNCMSWASRTYLNWHMAMELSCREIIEHCQAFWIAMSQKCLEGGVFSKHFKACYISTNDLAISV